MTAPRVIPGPLSSSGRRAASDPDVLGLGLRQCRLGQDACAGPARDPAAAVGHRSGAHPVHHLHQGRRRQHGEPRVRRPARLDGAGRRKRSTRPCATIGVKTIDARRRARARQLFALALETPGGLKVQTIHAFCTQLLHLFPFEANVAGALRGARRDRRDADARQAHASRCCWRPRRRRTAPLGRALAKPCSPPPT